MHAACSKKKKVVMVSLLWSAILFRVFFCRECEEKPLEKRWEIDWIWWMRWMNYRKKTGDWNPNGIICAWEKNYEFGISDDRKTRMRQNNNQFVNCGKSVKWRNTRFAESVLNTVRVTVLLLIVFGFCLFVYLFNLILIFFAALFCRASQ